MKQRAYLFRFAGALLFWSLLIFNSCGIYTTTAPLNPPFSQSVDSANLKFAGYNNEDYFVGYNIYYKEKAEDFYKVCDSIPIDDYPTIPVTPIDSIIQYTVDTDELRPQDDDRSFYDLYYTFDSPEFYFAVSAVGDEDEESERIEFGAWPTPATQ